jgi:hypothetical protein
MRAYQCYLRDQCDEICDVAELRCSDDLAAMDHALDLLAARNLRRALYTSVEIWDAARLVGVYPHAALPRRGRW